MKMKAWEWAVWIALCIAPLAAAAAALGSLPDTIALHAGVHGVIDRYGSKYVDSPRNARILFLVIGSIETIIAIGVVLSFGRGALAG